MSERIEINASGFPEAQAALAAAPEKAGKAIARAVRKTTDFAAAQLQRQLAAATGLPARALAGRRVRKAVAADGRSGSVWLGFAPVPAAYAVNRPEQLRQEDWGASAGPFLFPGAFVARMPTGHRGIFKRAGRARLPIDEQRVALTVAPGVAASVAELATNRLETLLSRELHYALDIEAWRE